MKKIKVNLNERSYQIHIGHDLFNVIPETLAKLTKNRQLAIISVPPVSELYLQPLLDHFSDKWTVKHTDVPDGESSKSSAVLENLYTWLLDNRIERQATIIALGGGVVGDLAGYAAATYLRGINLIHVPTSLLAQVDSSIGGKVGINHKQGKNLIGAFYQPRAIFTDVSVLHSLAPEEFICGIGEVIKYGVIKDRGLFALLEKQIEQILSKDSRLLHDIVYACAKIKADIVSQDEKESGLRVILNYGHTFAHVLETYYSHSGLKHGQAVLMGMVCANYLANRVNLLSKDIMHRIQSLIFSVPLALPAVKSIPDPQQLVSLMYLDKKVRTGKIRLILPRDIGEVTYYEVTDEKMLLESFAYLFDYVRVPDEPR